MNYYKDEIKEIKEIAIEGTCHLSGCSTCRFDKSCLGTDPTSRFETTLDKKTIKKAKVILKEIEFEKQFNKEIKEHLEEQWEAY